MTRAGRSLQLGEQLDEPREVAVVERRLDLVEDVERRGAGPEDGDQHRDRGQRPLAARQQRQPLDLLARGAGLDLDAGGEPVVGLGEHQSAGAAGEQRREDQLELPGDVLVGRPEDLLDPLVDLLDDDQQVATAGLEVLELLGEELVAFLERGELLERERVDLAQQRQRPLGRTPAASPAPARS